MFVWLAQGPGLHSQCHKNRKKYTEKEPKIEETEAKIKTEIKRQRGQYTDRWRRTETTARAREGEVGTSEKSGVTPLYHKRTEPG